MKINQDLRMNLNTNRDDLRTNSQGGNRFGEMVVKQGSKMQTEQLTRLLGDISTAGDRVARSRNLRELARFKMLVKRFLQEAVDHGLEMKQSHTWNRFGEGRRLKIVETIDERLVEYATIVVKEGQTKSDSSWISETYEWWNSDDAPRYKVEEIETEDSVKYNPSITPDEGSLDDNGAGVAINVTAVNKRELTTISSE